MEHWDNFDIKTKQNTYSNQHFDAESNHQEEKWETNINACITIYSLINGNDDVIYGPVNGVFYRFPFYEWPDMDIRWPE